MMKAYSFSLETGEYLGPVECQPDPVEGGYLLPGHATCDPPPAFTLREIAVWSGKWSVVPDYRRISLWWKQTALPCQLTLGEEPTVEMTEVPPPADERIQWDEPTSSWVIVPPTPEELERETERIQEQRLLSTTFVGRIILILVREVVAIRQGQPPTDAFKALLARLQEIYGA